MPGFLLIVFWILLDFQVYQILAICSNRQISKFNPDMPNDFNLVISPRPGIHYTLNLFYKERSDLVTSWRFSDFYSRSLKLFFRVTNFIVVL